MAQVDAGKVQATYKYQRLREQLREAVRCGSLKGKLPGERELGRRYQANAKTITTADTITQTLIQI